MNQELLQEAISGLKIIQTKSNQLTLEFPKCVTEHENKKESEEVIRLVTQQFIESMKSETEHECKSVKTELPW